MKCIKFCGKKYSFKQGFYKLFYNDDSIIYFTQNITILSMGLCEGNSSIFTTHIDKTIEHIDEDLEIRILKSINDYQKVTNNYKLYNEFEKYLILV